MRLDSVQYVVLLQMIDGLIKIQNTKTRLEILSATKLELILRYLSTGISFKSLEHLFYVIEPTILLFMPKVFIAISHALKPFIKVIETKKCFTDLITKMYLHLLNHSLLVLNG